MNRLIVSCQELSWLQELFFHNSIPFDISIFPLGFYTKSVSVFKVDHAYADVCAGMSAIFFQENWKFPVPSLSNSTLPMFIQRTIIANLGGYSLELVLGAGVDIRTQSAIVDLIRHHAQLSSISTNLPWRVKLNSWGFDSRVQRFGPNTAKHSLHRADISANSLPHLALRCFF